MSCRIDLIVYGLDRDVRGRVNTRRKALVYLSWDSILQERWFKRWYSGEIFWVTRAIVWRVVLVVFCWVLKWGIR